MIKTLDPISSRVFAWFGNLIFINGILNYIIFYIWRLKNYFEYDKIKKWFMPAWWNWQTCWTQNPVVATPCGFDPRRRHQRKIIRTCFRLAMGSDYCFSLTVTKLHTFATACGADPLPNRGDRGKRNDHKCQQGRYHTRYRPFSVFAALLPSCLAFCSCCQRANSRWLSSLS